MSRHPIPPVAILLAGGVGSRFDASGRRNKLLQPLPGDASGRSVASASAHALLTVLPRVIAVVRPDRPELMAQLRAAGCETVACEASLRGMGASLAAGVRASLASAPPAALGSPHGWLVALADMPFIRPASIRAVVNALDDPQAVIAPRYQGQRGHPVAFGQAHGVALAELDGDLGARALLRDSARVTWVDLDDPGIVRDIDTPADLDLPQ